MRLIGAGLPRTATLTQKIALEMLGFGPCYHMVDVLGDLNRVGVWTEAFEGGADWARIFTGYDSTVDWPGSFFYTELIGRYPAAKVLLSVRDSADWARSMTATIWDVLYGDNLVHDLSSARARIEPGWRGYMELMAAMWEKCGLLPSNAAGPDQTALAGAFERYNEEVQRTVPADRLLVWKPADGWEPLCEFLQAPVPQTPLPRLNDAKMFKDRVIDASLASLGRWREGLPRQEGAGPR